MGNSVKQMQDASLESRDNGNRQENVSASRHEETLSVPWRSFQMGGDWSVEYEQQLLREIKDPTCKGKAKNARILLVGPIKAGKSSLLNSTACIDKGRIAQVTAAGGEGTSMSKNLKIFRPQGKLSNFRLLDTMGVENAEEGGFNVKDLLFIIKGNVPPDYKFNPANPIAETDPSFNKNPSAKEKTHCVVFVLDASVAGEDNISGATKAKVGKLQEQLQSLDIPRIVVLTKVDLLCEKVASKISNLYTSAKVEKAVDVAKNLFHVPKMNIFPVQNYSEESDLDFKKNIPLLLALRQMVLFATDFINEQSAESSEEDEDH